MASHGFSEKTLPSGQISGIPHHIIHIANVALVVHPCNISQDILQENSTAPRKKVRRESGLVIQLLQSNNALVGESPCNLSGTDCETFLHSNLKKTYVEDFFKKLGHL